MPVIILNCPYCSAAKSTFNVWKSNWNKIRAREVSVAADCSSCGRSILATFYRNTVNAITVESINGNLIDSSNLRFLNVYPVPTVVSAPTDVPENVARAFVQASQNRNEQRWDSACAMYRKAMELGLKSHSPDVEAWKLEKRIDKLAAEHRITPELQTWAHELRLDGNDALHGDGDATEEITDQMHHLCWFLLTYLYTMPKQVKSARERREADAA